MRKPKRKIKLNINAHNTLTVKLLIGLSGLGIVLAIALAIKSNNLVHTNDTMMKLNENEIKSIGGDWVNSSKGNFINEGQSYFQGNIRNMSLMGCGKCRSGVSYISNTNNIEQIIDGSKSIQWYDVVLKNTGGLTLENELRVRNSFSFEEGMVYTDREKPQHFLHFAYGGIPAYVTAEKHVDGFAGFTGNGRLKLPIGDGNVLQPISMEGNDLQSFFKAAFHPLDPGINGFSLASRDSIEIKNIKEWGYWEIYGNSPTKLGLYWKAEDSLSNWVENLEELIVVGWDGSKWKSLGRTQISGDLVEGEIFSEEIDPSTFPAVSYGTSFPERVLNDSLLLRGSLIGRDGYLTWTSFENQAGLNYELQRSIDALSFTPIIKVKSNGRIDSLNNYDHWDKDINVGHDFNYYYKVKKIAQDGEFAYSNIVQLKQNHSDDFDIIVYPNPAYSKISVKVTAPSRRPYALRVYKINGQLVLADQVSSKQPFQHTISNWATGNYNVVVSNDSIQVAKRLVIAR